MGETIKKSQIDFSKIYNDEYAAAKKSGGRTVSEKNQQYWGNEGTKLEVEEVEVDGEKVYKINEIQADGTHIGMGFTTIDGITPEDTSESVDDTVDSENNAKSVWWRNHSSQIRDECKVKSISPIGEITYVNFEGAEFVFKDDVIVRYTNTTGEIIEYNEFGEVIKKTYPGGWYHIIDPVTNTTEVYRADGRLYSVHKGDKVEYTSSNISENPGYVSEDVIQHINKTNNTNYDISDIFVSYEDNDVAHGVKYYLINDEIYAETRKDGGIRVRANESSNGEASSFDIIYYPDGTEISINRERNAIVGLENIDASEKDTIFSYNYKKGIIYVQRNGYVETYDAKSGKIIPNEEFID